MTACVPLTPDVIAALAVVNRPRICDFCGKDAPNAMLCDWHKGGRCSKRICPECVYHPTAGKDLCPDHRQRWEHTLALKAAARAAADGRQEQAA